MIFGDFNTFFAKGVRHRGKHGGFFACGVLNYTRRFRGDVKTER